MSRPSSLLRLRAEPDVGAAEPGCGARCAAPINCKSSSTTPFLAFLIPFSFFCSPCQALFLGRKQKNILFLRTGRPDHHAASGSPPTVALLFPPSLEFASIVALLSLVLLPAVFFIIFSPFRFPTLHYRYHYRASLTCSIVLMLTVQVRDRSGEE